MHFPTSNTIEQQRTQLPSNNVNGENEMNSVNTLPSSSVLRQTNLLTMELDPFERKKNAALTKAEAKLEKAQRLYHTAQNNIEQNVSEFIRVTTLPGIISEYKPPEATFEKRIRTLEDTKKELEKKIANYQSDIARIKSGDIPYQYHTSKDILNNIKNKVSNNSMIRNRSTNDVTSTITVHDQSTSSQSFENEHFHNQNNLPSTSINSTGSVGNNTNMNSNIIEPVRSSSSNSITNEIGNSQFYIDVNREHIYEDDKLNRKHDAIISADISAIHDPDRSPTTKHFIDDSNVDSNDRISDHSTDERLYGNTTSRRNTTTIAEYHQLMIKFDQMQKTIDRYELKSLDMQKQIDSLKSTNEQQFEHNKRLKTDVNHLTDTHQNEILAMKTALKKLEDKLLYNLDECWTEMSEKLDKLDTRTTKIEQIQTHLLEPGENTHRLISKLVNIILTAFAIVLLLLSTIKNLVQSRVNALIILILVFVWITVHYFSDIYFHSSFYKNTINILTQNA